MFAIATLNDHIDQDKNLKSKMEDMLKAYILPELTSPIALLRLRACSTYSEFVTVIKFKDQMHI